MRTLPTTSAKYFGGSPNPGLTLRTESGWDSLTSLHVAREVERSPKHDTTVFALLQAVVDLAKSIPRRLTVAAETRKLWSLE
jgi:hypothetical protein